MWLLQGVAHISRCQSSPKLEPYAYFSRTFILILRHCQYPLVLLSCGSRVEEFTIFTWSLNIQRAVLFWRYHTVSVSVHVKKEVKLKLIVSSSFVNACSCTTAEYHQCVLLAFKQLDWNFHYLSRPAPLVSG